MLRYYPSVNLFHLGHSENRQIAVDKSIVTSSPKYSVRSCELRRNIKEIGENIANQFDGVKTKSESNVCKKRQYRSLVGVRLAARGDSNAKPV